VRYNPRLKEMYMYHSLHEPVLVVTDSFILLKTKPKLESSRNTHAFAIHPELRNYTKCKSYYFIIRFEILTAVVIEGCIFWDINMLPACYLFYASFLLGLFFDRLDEGDIFLWKFGWLSTDCTALNPRRPNSSCILYSTKTFSKITSTRDVRSADM
jgi:hypothetical protein